VKTVGNYWPYATTLYDYINRAMPSTAPGSLEPSEIYAVVAWILSENEIITPATVLDAASLPKVKMPARDRFVRDDRRPGATFH
jgi:cytochrome c